MTNRGCCLLVLLCGWIGVGASARAASVADVVQQVAPAVVTIEWREVNANVPGVRQPPAGFSSTRVQQAVCCGTIVSADGLIVAPGPSSLPLEASDLTVRFADGSTRAASRMVVDRRTELSLLKVKVETPHFVQLADGNTRVGGVAISIGRSPVSELTAAVGIVSAVGRSIGAGFPHVLQTDLSVSSLSGGSPLVDEKGRLLGITVARSQRRASGIAFAIPAEHVRALLDNVAPQEPEEIVVLERPYLGVTLASEAADAKQAVVRSVAPGSPAANAGLAAQDEILAIGDIEVDSADSLMSAVARQETGALIRVRIQRQGKEFELPARLTARPAAGNVGPPTIAQYTPSRILVPPNYQPSGRVQGALQDYLVPRPTVLRVESPQTEQGLEELRTEVAELRDLVESLRNEIRALRAGKE